MLKKLVICLVLFVEKFYFMSSRIHSICHEVRDNKVIIDTAMNIYKTNFAYYFPSNEAIGGVIIDGITTNFTDLTFTKSDIFRNSSKICNSCYKDYEYANYELAIQSVAIENLKNGWHNITTTNTYSSLIYSQVENYLCWTSEFFVDGIDGEILCNPLQELSEIECPKEIILKSTEPNTCQGTLPDLKSQIKWKACKYHLYQSIRPRTYFHGEVDVTIYGVDEFKAFKSCQIKVKQDSGYFKSTELISSKNFIWPPNNKMIEIDISGIEFSCPNIPISCSLNIETNDKYENRVANIEDYEITGELSVKLRARKNKDGSKREYIIKVTCLALDYSIQKYITIFVEKGKEHKN